ncbi:MAG TPA: DUF1801 domain-containing protein [Allosphingosinicella sp.]|jgi:hypothetical protein
MAENKTRETGEGFEAFLETVADPARRADARALGALMARVTAEAPVMWGRIVGFGRCHYRYESGREGDWMLVGFAVRAKELVLYLGLGAGGFEDLFGRLGKHKTGKGCLYLKTLADADPDMLEALVGRAYAESRERHPS